MTKPILENNSIRLRALEPNDIELLMHWENDSSLWEFGDTIAPISRIQIANFLKSYDGDIFTSKQVRFIIEEQASKTPTGTIDMFDFDFFNSRVAIGILVEKEYRKCGYARQALELTVNYAESFLGIHQCYAIVSESNTPSIELFTSCGFTHESTFKQWLRVGTEWHDALLMQHIGK